MRCQNTHTHTQKTTMTKTQIGVCKKEFQKVVQMVLMIIKGFNIDNKMKTIDILCYNFIFL